MQNLRRISIEYKKNKLQRRILSEFLSFTTQFSKTIEFPFFYFLLLEPAPIYIRVLSKLILVTEKGYQKPYIPKWFTATYQIL